MVNKRSYFVFLEEENVLTEVVDISFKNNTLILKDDLSNLYTVNKDEVQILEEILRINGESIVDMDVLRDKNGYLFLIELHEDGKVQMNRLNEDLEVKYSGKKLLLNESDKRSLEEQFSLVGNLYQLLNEKLKEPTFNIQVVKDDDINKYYYACNNKEKHEIDLIKVIFVGHLLLEEENHEKITVSYEEYNNMIRNNHIQESSPSELLSYVTSAINNDLEDEDEDEGESNNTYEEVNSDQEYDCGIGEFCCGYPDGCSNETLESDEEVICDKCKEFKDVCFCELWNERG